MRERKVVPASVVNWRRARVYTMASLLRSLEHMAPVKPPWQRLTEPLEHVAIAFLSALQSSPRRTRGLAFDCGAHDGRWSAQLLDTWANMSAAPRLRLHMLEPQRTFARRLRYIEAATGGRARYHPVVASTHNGNATLFSSLNSETSSLRLTMAARYGYRGHKRVIDAIDLADMILDATVPSTSRVTSHADTDAKAAPPLLTFLKLDIEASEFSLLPRLVVSGALCRIHFVLIEWHLNALRPAERLSGLGMLLSLEVMLRSGCPAPPVLQQVVPHANNEGVEVPGLREAAKRHAASNRTRADRDIWRHWARAGSSRP